MKRPLVYVAGSFSRRVDVKEAQEALVKIGYDIAHDWTGESDEGLTGAERQAFLEKCALADYEGVLASDVVLLLNNPHCFGTMTEFGLALAWGRTVYVVGPQVRDNIFFHLPEQMGVRLFDNLEQALEAMRVDLVLAEE